MRGPYVKLLVALLVPLCGSSGTCDGFRIGPGGQVCTAIAVPSVVLRITGATGGVVGAANIAFTINGGPVSASSCSGDCGDVTLAFEATGRFDITVSAPGFAPATRTVNVSLDAAGCHPVTQTVTVVLVRDETVGALAGAWRTVNLFGETILRFGSDGRAVGAILVDRTIGGDGNFYVAYNGRGIRGAPGQPIYEATVPEPTRSGNSFTFSNNTLGTPTGFENATMSADALTLTGQLGGFPVSYSRLAQIPSVLEDP